MTYRLRRYNEKNLVIETQRHTAKGHRWVIVGYYGSAWGMASALVDMLTDCPGADDIAAQVDKLMALIDQRTDAITAQLEAIFKQEPAAVIELEV